MPRLSTSSAGSSPTVRALAWGKENTGYRRVPSGSWVRSAAASAAIRPSPLSSHKAETRQIDANVAVREVPCPVVSSSAMVDCPISAFRASCTWVRPARLRALLRRLPKSVDMFRSLRKTDQTRTPSGRTQWTNLPLGPDPGDDIDPNGAWWCSRRCAAVLQLESRRPGRRQQRTFWTWVVGRAVGKAVPHRAGNRLSAHLSTNAIAMRPFPEPCLPRHCTRPSPSTAAKRLRDHPDIQDHGGPCRGLLNAVPPSRGCAPA